MSDPIVTIARIEPRILAAVRKTVPPREISTAFKDPLDQVWAFLRTQPGLRTGGHNVFLYHHVARPELGMPIDFGVEVTRHFDPAGDVHAVETPAGDAAVAVHRGPYSGLSRAHEAIHRWCATNGRTIGAYSLEIYGDWSSDPDQLETTIQYVLQ